MGKVYAAHPGQPGHPDGELDLPGIGRAISRKKRLIALVTLGALAASLAFVVLVKPRYTGEAKVLVENQESYFTRPSSGQGAPDAAPDSEAVASQVQVIMSRDLAREAIRRLGLKGNPEFDPAAGGEGLAARMLTILGLRRDRALSPEDRIFEKYSEKLKVFVLPKSRVLTIEFNARDAALAARGANTVAELYIEIQSKAKREQASASAASLATLISELRTKLAEAETRVETFRASSGLLMGTNNSTVPTQQLGEISTQLAAARSAMAESQAKARLIRSLLQRGRLDELSDVARDDLVRRVAENRTNLRARLASESRTLGPAHPRIQELNAQLATVERELRVAGSNVARGLENDAQIARTRVDNLVAAIEQQKRQVGDTSADQVKLREYEMEAKLLREQLEGNTTKYREALARQQSESTPADARVISRAAIPDRPSFPKVMPILLFATLGALILTISGVIAAELLSGRALIEVQQELAALRRAPRESQAGQAGGGDDPGARTVAGNENIQPVFQAPALDPAAKRVLARLQSFDTRGYGARVLVSADVDGGDPGAAIEALARTLAGERRTILVDFSGRARQGEAGLAEVLNGTAGFGEIIHRDGASRLHLAGSGAGVSSVSEELDEALDALSQTYEYVFLVMPQLVAGDFILEFAPACDVCVLVAGAASGANASARQQELLEAGAGQVIILAAPRVAGVALDAA